MKYNNIIVDSSLKLMPNVSYTSVQRGMNDYTDWYLYDFYFFLHSIGRRRGAIYGFHDDKKG